MILGRFSLTQTEDGNLQGEFTNQLMIGNSPERANFRPNQTSNDNFVGEYESTWSDPKEGVRFANLEIQLVPNTQLFILTWRNRDERIEFHGQAIVIDNRLTGSYMDGQLLNLIIQNRNNLRTS